MAAKSIPIPPDPIGENYTWREWLQRLSNRVYGSMGSQDSNTVAITGGTIAGTAISGSTITTSTIDLISAIQNVNIVTPLNNQVLTYNTATLKWINFAAGSGTVTSVACTVPSIFSIAGSPITTAGTLAITYSGTALPPAVGVAELFVPPLAIGSMVTKAGTPAPPEVTI